MIKPALLLATASIAAGVLVAPGAALAADTTVNLTQPEMKAALQGVVAATTTASAKGWATTGVDRVDGDYGITAYSFDAAGGRAYARRIFPYPDGGEAGPVGALRNTTGYAVARKGTYRGLTTALEKAAVKMARLPKATFVFTPSTKLDLALWIKVNSLPPASVVTGGSVIAGTKTTHDDGSVTYAWQNTSVGEHVLDVDSAGVATRKKVSSDQFSDVTWTFRYGPRTINLPSNARTVGSATLTKALAYLNLTTRVKNLAGKSAADVRKAANGHPVKVSTLRAVVRRDVAAYNKAAKVKVVAVGNITGGVRIYARNPWTGLRVTYWIKASGKRVVVTKK